MKDDLAEISRRLNTGNMADLLRELSPKAAGANLKLTCPECHENEAYIYPPKGNEWPIIHCNRLKNCGYNSRNESLWHYILAREGSDIQRAKQVLAQAVNYQLDAGSDPPGATRPRYTKPAPRTTNAPVPEWRETEIPEETPAEMQRLNRIYQANLLGSPGQRYLEDVRGIPLDVALEAGYGYCSEFPVPASCFEKRPRITYPMRTRAGEIVAIEGRLLPSEDDAAHGKARPKCLQMGALKTTCMFLPDGQFSPEELMVTEGAIDAMALYMAGFNAASSCGPAKPEWLIRACSRNTIWLAQDGDGSIESKKGGEYAASRLAEEMAAALVGIHPRRLCPPTGFKDWGETLVKTVQDGDGTRIVRRPLLERQTLVWRAQNLPEYVVTMRIKFYWLNDQITRLLDGRIQKGQTKKVLIDNIGQRLDTFIMDCDIPGEGYHDATDPYARDAIGSLVDAYRQLAPQYIPPIRDSAFHTPAMTSQYKPA